MVATGVAVLWANSPWSTAYESLWQTPVPGARLVTLRRGPPARRVPLATDVAFSVGVMTVLGRRVPGPLRILVLTLATADDLGATR